MIKAIILILGILTLLRYTLPEIRKLVRELRFLLSEVEKFFLELVKILRKLSRKLNSRL